MEDKELNELISKAVEKATAEGVKAGMEAAVKAQPKTEHVVMGESEEDKVAKGQIFKNGADFLYNVYKSAVKKNPTDVMSRYDAALKAVQGQSVTTDADGGYLVPTILSSELLKTELAAEIALPRCRKIPMQTNNLSIPYLADKNRNTNNSARDAILHYIVDEGATITKSKIAVNKLALSCFKLGILTYVTREIVEDSPISMQAILSQAAPEQLAFAHDSYFINGAGTTEPLGAINAANAALKTVTRAGAGALAAADVLGMYNALSVPSRRRACWIAGSNCFASLAQMTVSSVPVYLPMNQGNVNSNLAMAPAGTLLGLPLFFSEHAAALGADGDLNLVDFSQYIVGTRGGVSFDSSIHCEFLTDQVCFRWIERLDGKPGWYAVEEDLLGNTFSPFVKLVT